MVGVLCSPHVPSYSSLSHPPSISLLFYVSLFSVQSKCSLTPPTCTSLSLSPDLSLSDVEIDVPDELDITLLRGCGLQPGEVELPEGDAPPSDQASVAVEIDEGVVLQLMSMGFDMEGCRKAVFHTKNQGRWRQELG